MIDYIRETWEEMHPALRRIIIAEVAIIVALLILIGIMEIASAETYTCVVHKGEWVWIREAPSYDAKQIGQIRYGYEVEVDSFTERSDFAHITWHGIDGYVASQYLELPVEEKLYRVICEGPLAKRETPAGRLLCWIKPGSKISVLGWRHDKNGDLWARVYKGGYVKASFLAEL
jgi:hypothetical protein